MNPLLAQIVTVVLATLAAGVSIKGVDWLKGLFTKLDAAGPVVKQGVATVVALLLGKLAAVLSMTIDGNPANWTSADLGTLITVGLTHLLHLSGAVSAIKANIVKVAILCLAVTGLSACVTPASASPPKHVAGLVAVAVGDSVKVSAVCAPNQLSDTLYTVKCRNIVTENGVTVATFDLAMNASGSVTYFHVPVTGTPGSTTTISVTLQQYGVNRSGALSSATSQVLTTAPITIADGAPSAPKGVGGSVKFCPSGQACP